MNHARYFEPREFRCPCGCKSPFYEWNVDAELVELCDKIRESYGAPIRVDSAYRCAEHNLEVGGVVDSFHTKGKAADLHPVKGRKTQEEIKSDVLRLQKIACAVNRYGGVGLYDWGVHVDVRGYGARWDYRSKK